MRLGSSVQATQASASCAYLGFVRISYEACARARAGDVCGRKGRCARYLPKPLTDGRRGRKSTKGTRGSIRRRNPTFPHPQQAVSQNGSPALPPPPDRQHRCSASRTALEAFPACTRALVACGCRSAAVSIRFRSSPSSFPAAKNEPGKLGYLTKRERERAKSRRSGSLLLPSPFFLRPTVGIEQLGARADGPTCE